MRNMKVRKKLLLGFVIVVLICAAVGGIGIYGMEQINNGSTLLYDNQTEPLLEIAKVLEYSQRVRVSGRNAILYSGDIAMLEKVEGEINSNIEIFETYLVAYSETIQDPEARIAYDEAVQIYHSEYKPIIYEVLELAKEGVSQELLIEKMSGATAITVKMVDDFTFCMNQKVAGGKAADENNTVLYTRMLLIISIVIAVAVAVSLLLAFYISNMISRPIGVMSTFLTRFGSSGDLLFTDEDREYLEHASHDEIGICQRSLGKVVERLIEIDKRLGKVADGDLSEELKLLSERDSIGIAIDQMVESLNDMFSGIRVSSQQVSAGSEQVSQAAQGLASGSSQQAASIEEFSSAIAELQQKIEHNANNSMKARDANQNSEILLAESIRSMSDMLEAMKSIQESSGNITKVIKVIDDIAFQTNILALNAAVESARAGQHGKGFAVVADEVRNLASKSAAAAKETAVLIEGSSERVREGTKILEATGASLRAVTESAHELTQIVSEVAESSADQARSIVEINHGIEQISTVVQANSATAEESAAAAEEMSAQAVILDEAVASFKLKKVSAPKKEAEELEQYRVSAEHRPENNFQESRFALAYAKY